MIDLKKQLKPNIEEDQMIPSRTALRRHPFYLGLPPLTLPDELDRVVIDYLRDHCLYSIKHLNQLSTRLVNFLHERSLPSIEEISDQTPSSLRRNTIPVSDSFQETSDDPGVDNLLQYHHEKSFIGAHREFTQARKAATGKWQSLTYSKENSQLYLVGRLSPNFAVACRVLYEIRKRCPLFVPNSLFDFASGLGTYTWAANTVWPAGCIRQHYMIEASSHMTAISEFLLQKRGQGHSPSATVYPNISHRRFMPSVQVTADLVMSGYALLEIAGAAERQRVVESLWGRTNDFLVLIEEGTKAGFAAILEARNYLINRGGDEMSIFAPCHHKLGCGKSGMTCASGVRYYKFGLTKDVTYPSEEKFSYLVVCRGDARRFHAPSGNAADEGSVSFPRVIGSPSGGDRHHASTLDVDFCLPNGNCERVTFSKSATHRSLFFFLKRCQAGDIAPCVRENDEDLLPEQPAQRP